MRNGKKSKIPEVEKWDLFFGTRRARPPNGFSRAFFENFGLCIYFIYLFIFYYDFFLNSLIFDV
jgi:hypothetical protein